MPHVVRQEDQGWLVLHPEGDLDRFTAGAFEEQLAGLAGEATVVVDLTDVPFVDSAGLGALVAGIRAVRGAGGAVTVVAGRRPLRRLFDMTGLARIVTIVGAMAEVPTSSGVDALG